MYAESKKIGRQGVKPTVVGSSPARGELFSKKKLFASRKPISSSKWMFSRAWLAFRMFISRNKYVYIYVFMLFVFFFKLHEEFSRYMAESF